MASRPSSRALATLVQSTNPLTTRPSRLDDADTAKEKEGMLQDLVEVARRSLEQHHTTKQPDTARSLERIRRRLARSPNSQATLAQVDALLARLDDLEDQPAELPAILAFLSQMTLSGPSTSSSAAATTATAATTRASLTPSVAHSAAPSSAAASRSSSRAAPRGSLESTITGRGPPPAPAPDAERERKTMAAETAARAQEVDAGRKRAEKVREERQPLAPVAPTVAVIDDSDLGIGSVSKSLVLERWRAKASQTHVSERDLLRDVLFLLQGINGHHIRFEEERSLPLHDPGVISTQPSDHEPIVKVKIVDGTNGARIPLPTRHLIHRLAEAGKHYPRITSFIRAQAVEEKSGRVMQSLCRFLDDELHGYYALICDLEAHYNRGLADSPDAPPALTLKKVSVDIEPSLLRMRLMSSLVEGAQHAHGGALVSLIHNYTYNGDPLIRSFTERLLQDVSRGFFGSLAKWIYEGELSDPFGEFFVAISPDAAKGAAASSSAVTTGRNEIDAAALWEHKFTFRSDLVPTFLAETFARKIFSAGKSLNFIRESCGDDDWKQARSAILSASSVGAQSSSNGDEVIAQAPTLSYRDLVGLERTIDAVHSTISKRLLDIFLDKFKLQAHLRAINDYLLLTRGDFSEVLMESLAPILHKPASLLYRHSLSGALETAIRGSNAQYDDAEVLHRLDARVLEFLGNETGWDTFTLEYRVDSPVNTVLDAGAMAEYQAIFQHLWKMKRVETALAASCAKLMGATNALSKAVYAKGVKGRKRREAEKDEDVEALRLESHRSLITLSSMTHFLRQLQGYVDLEVISYSWADLVTFLDKRQGDLDVLIAAHRGYLTSLHGKVMLRGGSGDLAGELRHNFDSILAFTRACDQLTVFLVDFLARRDLYLNPRLRDDDGEDGEQRRRYAEDEEDEATARRLSTILRLLGDSGQDFKERTEAILTRLERHGNLVIRDLSVRLDFNGYHARTRPERTTSGGGMGRSSGAR